MACEKCQKLQSTFPKLTVICKHIDTDTRKGVTEPDKNGRCHDDHTGALASCDGGSEEASPEAGGGSPAPGHPPPKKVPLKDPDAQHELTPEAQKLDNAELHAVGHYAMTGYKEINTTLRGTHAPSPLIQRQIDFIDSAIEKSEPIPESMVVYRGIRNLSFMGPEAQMPKSLVGKTITDKGFLSTTQNRDIAANFSRGKGAQLIIELPKGTKALDVAKVEDDSATANNEREILVHRNASLLITKVDVMPGNRIFITCKLTNVNKGVTEPDKNGRCHDDHTGALASCGTGGSSESPKNPSKTPEKTPQRAKPTTTAPEDKKPSESRELSDEEHTALDVYQGPNFKDINNKLRGKPFEEIPQGIDKTIAALDAAMEKMKLEHDVIIYRGIRSLKFLKGQDPKDVVGKVIEDKGYTSTTASQTVAASFMQGGEGKNVRMQIHVPAGTQAIDMRDALPENDKSFEEHEILLHRSSKMKVMKVDEHGNTVNMYCTIVAKPVGSAMWPFGDKKPKEPSKPQAPRAPSKDTISGPVGEFKKVTIDGNHMAKNHVGEVSSALTSISQTYPNVVKAVMNSVETVDNFANIPEVAAQGMQTAVAFCEYDDQKPEEKCKIKINGAFFAQDDVPYVKNWVKDQWCPAGCDNINGILHHEFGHAFHWGLRQKVPREKYDKDLQIMLENPLSRQPEWSASTIVVEARNVNVAILENETFAETFAAMNTGKFDNHPSVQALKRIMATYEGYK